MSRADLALAFDESTASSAEVLVEGANFYPRDARGHRRGLVVDPHQPVRLPPGTWETGSRRRSSPRRETASRFGSSSTGRAPTPSAGRSSCTTSCRGRSRGLRRAGDEAAGRRPARSAATRRAALEPRRARAHRPSQGRRRGRPDRLGRRRRDRGSLRGRALPRPVPPVDRAGGRRSSSSSSSRACAGLAGEPDGDRCAVPGTRAPGDIPAVVLHNAPGQLPADHRRDREPARRRAARRSTSSTPTSRTAG